MAVMIDWQGIIDTTIAYRKGSGFVHYPDEAGLRNELAAFLRHANSDAAKWFPLDRIDEIISKHEVIEPACLARR
jgi:hypothetical protein